MSETLPLSVVIPVFNEEETIPYLYAEVRAALEKLGTPYEVLVVDDGSTDGSLARLIECTRDDPRWRAIALRRNFGQTAALAAGFDYARGNVIVTLDGDLQNDPQDVGKRLARTK